MLTFLFYAISCLACGPSTRHLLGFKGVDAYDYHPTLLPLVVLFCVLTIASWTSLVWLQPDPGMVDTRSVDFEEVEMYTVYMLAMFYFLSVVWDVTN